jgi:hypothetical protein
VPLLLCSLLVVAGAALLEQELKYLYSSFTAAAVQRVRTFQL